MLLREKVEFVSEEKQLDTIMNKFFINFMESLLLKKDRRNVILDNIFIKIIFHKGIDKIRKTYEINNKFSFQQVTEAHVRQVISWIDSSKATPVEGFPVDMLQVWHTPFTNNESH